MEEQGRVEEAIHFGPDAEAKLVYELRSDPDVETVRASYGPSRITVRLPTKMVETWASSDQVSLTGEQAIGDARQLAILVEKDFKCVVPRSGEEDHDGFPNPAANC